MNIKNIITDWLKDTTQKLDIKNLGLTEWPKQLIGKEHLIFELDCSRNYLISLPYGLINLTNLNCSHNILTRLPDDITNLTNLNCINGLTFISKSTKSMIVFTENRLPLLGGYDEFVMARTKTISNGFSYYKKRRAIKDIIKQELRKAGIKQVVKVLKNRLYLPRLDKLHHELIWSPNHPGKFFAILPRTGIW